MKTHTHKVTPYSVRGIRVSCSCGCPVEHWTPAESYAREVSRWIGKHPTAVMVAAVEEVIREMADESAA